MKIIPLSEGSFTVDATKRFVPFEKYRERMEDRPKGSLLVEIQPFALVTASDILVLDSGLGFQVPGGGLQIHRNLREQGIQPGEVTRVLVSHLHKDHAGGLGVEDPRTGMKQPTFPNALYYINRQELEYAFSMDGKSYHAEDFKFLAGQDRLVLLEGSGEVGNGIHYEWTGGHCPYHQVFLVEDGGIRAFFGGDVAPQASQMKNRFMANYDYEPKRSMELRQEFAQRGRAGDWTFLFYHDTRTPSAQLAPV
ncbi:MAG TPA: MBL fold metallo-hydrolase [Chitinophagaceae bacterium]|nr:MBL fold metallo-hydrolase [Chitinophagaceae bacterium]